MNPLTECIQSLLDILGHTARALADIDKRLEAIEKCQDELDTRLTVVEEKTQNVQLR